MDSHVPESGATEEHQNNHQVDQAAKIEVAQVDLDWQHKGELFIDRWAHDINLVGNAKGWQVRCVPHGDLLLGENNQ